MARMVSTTHRLVRWTATLGAAAAILLATTGAAAAAPRSQPATGVNQDLAKQHLTAARNVLSDVTQLPAAAQLTGETRTRVQQLISNFNELIAMGPDWRGPDAKVEASLAALLGPDEPAPASGTIGAVGTSGTASAIDPAMRAMLVEFRTHLNRFETVAGGRPSPEPAAPLTPAPLPTPTPDAPPVPPADPPVPPSTPPVPIDDRPDSPPETVAVTDDDQEVTVVAREVLLHVEAVEVILGAQAAAQKAAVAAAGGTVVSTQTASGSTRTTITSADVTLNASQLDQIQSHLKELRRLVEKK